VDNGNGNGHGNVDGLVPYEPEKPAAPKTRDEQLVAFLAAYLDNGFNAVQACISIGMSASNAHAHRYLKACRHNAAIQKALDAVGLDPIFVAQRIRKLALAKEVKWNLRSKKWNVFENTTAQLEALKQINRLRNLYPAEPATQDPVTINFIFDV
jgi:hypothetical protein